MIVIRQNLKNNFGCIRRRMSNASEKHPKTVAKIEKYRIAFVFQYKSVSGYHIVL
jgi:hypothetical protein